MQGKSTKIIAAVSIFIFLVSSTIFVGFAFIVYGQKVKFEEMGRTYAESKSRRESIENLTRILDETKEDRTTLISRIITEEDVIDLLSLIETLGKEQGVELETNSLNITPFKNDFFEIIVINVNVRGSHEGVMHLLKLFEHLPYQSSISSVSISKVEGSVVWDG